MADQKKYLTLNADTGNFLLQKKQYRSDDLDLGIIIFKFFRVI